MTPAQKLASAWAHLPLNPPASLQQIARLEGSCRAPLPEPFLDYLKTTDGLAADDHLHCFWSTDQMLQTSDTLQHLDGTTYLTFADYCVRSHDYALNLSTGSVAIIGGDHPVEVAQSFTAFVDAYLRGAVSPRFAAAESKVLRPQPDIVGFTAKHPR